MDDHTIATWIEPIIHEGTEGDTVSLSVPNRFFISWIKDNYLEKIVNTMEEISGSSFRVDFISRDDFSPARSGMNLPPDEPGHGSRPFNEARLTQMALDRRLNPMYTFDSFVVGKCNEFAHAAAMAVSENLGGSYNPLFIYAGVGLGKTHLMSSIGQRVLYNNPSKKIYFTTSEEFTNEMVGSIQHDKMVEFRNKYRNVDLLLIDDIQFLAKKERTQEEFFHTFNSIYENRKQIVITSDRFPHEINNMEERLKSRFQLGLVADMGTPDLETRIAILKRKAYEDSVNIPDDVALLLAEQAVSNIRELVGSLIRLVAMSSLQGKPISIELAQACFKDRLNRPPKQVTIDTIINNISRTFNVKGSDLKSKKKHKMYSRPRQVAMYLARELTQLSYPEIGQAFGGKDHSTVIYATRKIEKQLKDDSQLQRQIEVLKKDIRG
jgi:chromosomal replication initiator protein